MESFILHKLTSSNESFDDSMTPTPTWTYAFHLLSLVALVYAVYLSWTCNTKIGRNTIQKVLRAFGASLIPFIYLIWYGISGCPLPQTVSSVPVSTTL